MESVSAFAEPPECATAGNKVGVAGQAGGSVEGEACELRRSERLLGVGEGVVERMVGIKFCEVAGRVSLNV